MARRTALTALFVLAFLLIAQLVPGSRVLGQGPPQPVPPRGYLTAPSDLPNFEVTHSSGHLGDGYLFVSMYGSFGNRGRYNMILDNNGEPVYYVWQASNSYDFKKQQNGQLSFYSDAGGGPAFVTMNNQYEIVREITAAGADPDSGEPYEVDVHELLILDDDEALILVHDQHIADMSEIVEGGSEEAVVIGCVIQIVDKNNDLLFQWRSWDHIPITDTYAPLNLEPLRYVHCNGVEEDNDGNLLLNSRNLNEVTKISRQTGEILWRMGGRQNEFTFINDPGFSVQHDARRLANGNMTIYDNANFGGKPSRGVEYEIDEEQKTAEKVVEFLHEPAVTGWAMGNVQRLPNGNSVVGWGSSSIPVLTEYDASGNRLLELRTDLFLVSYRAFRFPWQGYPTWPPVLVAYAAENSAHLHFSWNGSTETAAYLISGGLSPATMMPLFKVNRDGFETTFDYDLPQDGIWYFQVRPIDNMGAVGPPSNIAIAAVDTVYLPIFNGQ